MTARSRPSPPITTRATAAGGGDSGTPTVSPSNGISPQPVLHRPRSVLDPAGPVASGPDGQRQQHGPAERHHVHLHVPPSSGTTTPTTAPPSTPGGNSSLVLGGKTVVLLDTFKRRARERRSRSTARSTTSASVTPSAAGRSSCGRSTATAPRSCSATSPSRSAPPPPSSGVASGPGGPPTGGAVAGRGGGSLRGRPRTISCAAIAFGYLQPHRLSGGGRPFPMMCACCACSRPGNRTGRRSSPCWRACPRACR